MKYIRMTSEKEAVEEELGKLVADTFDMENRMLRYIIGKSEE